MDEMDVVIITGLSGAGKTQAMRVFQDYGYFCVDNLPPALLPTFMELCRQSVNKIDRIALVIDLRGGDFFDKLFESLNELKAEGYKYRILFLEASEEALVKRYKESRHRHPLAFEGRIVEGINFEREKMSKLREAADYIIDTSSLKLSELKEEIVLRFIENEKENQFLINIVSFGFKKGIPLDADLVFDVRFLPNPYYIEDLKEFTGKDKKVKDFVMKWPESKKFLEKLADMVKFLIPYYIREGKTQLIIGIGCTGGKHRSVVLTNELAAKLKTDRCHVITDHRDL